MFLTVKPICPLDLMFFDCQTAVVIAVAVAVAVAVAACHNVKKHSYLKN
jgi:hypothetical protein